MISVVIRTKNQATALSFLLSNLTTRYENDIAEVIVIDNCSTDSSQKVAQQYGIRFETITDFSYGGSANFAASKAKNDIVVIFSAHSYPVSPNFFKEIKERFLNNTNLAGVRCLHASNDYENYINGISALEDPNRSGLIFSGSAFAKAVWQKIPFNEDVVTFEDKDWTKRVLKAGYDIEFAPVIFNYNIQRNRQQNFFRFKNDLYGNYQIWHAEPKMLSAFKGLIYGIIRAMKSLLFDVFYGCKRFFAVVQFKFNKPEKFEY